MIDNNYAIHYAVLQYILCQNRKDNWANISGLQTLGSTLGFTLFYITNMEGEPWVKPGVWRPEIWALSCSCYSYVTCTVYGTVNNQAEILVMASCHRVWHPAARVWLPAADYGPLLPSMTSCPAVALF
jgi:hypothetical protein